eukprot:331973-Alexandrium_andersonii.AAC.1
MHCVLKRSLRPRRGSPSGPARAGTMRWRRPTHLTGCSGVASWFSVRGVLHGPPGPGSLA